MALLAGAVVMSGAAAIPATAAPPVVTAADGPGVVSHFDLARKDCLGTARNTTSKIWYTVANGVLSDVYAPDHRHHQRPDHAVPWSVTENPSPICRPGT